MNVLSIILQSILIAMFLMSGITKVTGQKMHVDNFRKWGYPQWFRVVTGLTQLVAALLLSVGYWESSWTALGALLLTCVGIGGVLTHVKMKDSLKDSFMILLLGVIAIVLFFLHASALSEFPGF
ncbi:DoxX family protein [Paenibacillus sp. HB172176]|uniref:DoxX family protein n=1 Tax=Paenibacillus sp. HB172176 TaxID=2493690 RepID=UPI00143ABE6A|nr:DoxX family protein [Paenibacillus sp. HB172176]